MSALSCPSQKATPLLSGAVGLVQPDGQELTRLDVWREVVEETLYDVTWITDTEASITCPGGGYHTMGDDKATVFLDHVPTIHCFHDSCQPALEAANEELRAECRQREKEAGFTHKMTRAEKVAWLRRKKQETRDKAHRRAVLSVAKEMLPDIVKEYRSTLADWIEASPSDVPRMAPSKHLRGWLSALPADWRIWIGRNLFETGTKWSRFNFDTPTGWLDRTQDGFSNPWTQCSVANYATWTIHRVNAAVVERRLLTVEFDRLHEDPTTNKLHSLAVLNYLQDAYDVRIFSICDSGNKSLHSLIGWPVGGPEEFKEATLLLEGFGADRQCFKLASTCRLPGGWRFSVEDGLPVAWQRLYFLDPAALDGMTGSSLLTHPDHKPDLQSSIREHKTETAILQEEDTNTWELVRWT